MNRKQAVTVGLVFLIVAYPVLAASPPLESIVDDGDTGDGFNRTSPYDGEITTDPNGDLVMDQLSSSHRDYLSGKGDLISGNHIVGLKDEDNDGNDELVDGRGYNPMEKVTDGSAKMKYHVSGAAYYNGNHYYVADDGGAYTNVFRWNEPNGETQVADLGNKDVGGMANIAACGINDGAGDNSELILGDVSGAGFTSDDFVVVDLGDGGTQNIAESNGKEFEIHGMAYHPDACKVWAYDQKREAVLLLEFIKSDGSVDILQQHSEPTNNIEGLAYNTKSETFYAYDQTSNNVIGFECSGGSCYSEGSEFEYSDSSVDIVGAVDHGSGESFDNGKFTVWDNSNNDVEERTTDYLTGSGPNYWESVWLDPTGGKQTVEVTAKFGLWAYQKWGSYDAKLQTSTDGSTWTTRKTITVQGPDPGSLKSSKTSASPTFEINPPFKIRLVLDPGQHHGTGDYYPAYIDGSGFDGGALNNQYSWYPENASARTHALDNPGIGIDTGDIAAAKNLTIKGGSPGTTRIDLKIENADGNTICKVDALQNGLAETTVNLTNGSCNWDESNPANQRIHFYYNYTSGGSETAWINSWELTYEERSGAPEITEYTATIGGKNTTDLSGETGVNARDTFNITHVNQSVEEVTWYVNGEVVNRTSVSSDGPFVFQKNWSDTGTYTVTGEVFDENNGTASLTWNVTVYDIAIQGRDSFSKSIGTRFDVRQTFRVFNVQNAQITYQVVYNESVVEYIGDQENLQGTVSSGNSRVWTFYAEKSNYTGQPIKVIATYGNKTSVKEITVTTPPQSDIGNVVVGNGGLVGILLGILLTHTWLEFLIPNLPESTYYWAQGILAFGWIAALWLISFRVGDILPAFGPRWIRRRLRGFQNLVRGFRLSELVLISAVGAPLTIGMYWVAWILTVFPLGFGIWWRVILKKRFDQLIPPEVRL